MTKADTKHAIDNLLHLYSSFINSFDGSPDAFVKAEPIMNELFDPSFTFITDKGPRDLQWYKTFAESFASEEGNVARVTHIKPISKNGSFQVTIKNIVKGVELDLIAYNATSEKDENGQFKVTYFEPTADGSEDTDDKNHNVENVGKMIQLVGKCGTDPPDDEMIMFICRMKLDSNKVDDFKYHASKALQDIKSTETNGTQSFEFYFSEAERSNDCTISCHTVERYRDSSAAIEHVRNMKKNVHRNAAITAFGKITVLEVYGLASEELVSLLNDEDYDVKYHEPSVWQLE